MRDDDNPYAAPQGPLDVPDDPTLAWDNVTAAELQAYIGPRASYYLRTWRRALERRGAWVGFNWPAMLLCPLWLAYRRMYVETCIVWAVVFGLTEVSEAIFMDIRVGRPSKWHGIALFVAFVGVPLTCGAIGNRRYLRRALRAVTATRAFGLTGDQASARLAHLGRTNLLGAIGVNLLCVCGVSVVDYLVMTFVY